MMINDSYGFFDVRKMGAAGDGVSDDTAAFQAAVDAAAAQEGIVFVPPGKYLYSGSRSFCSSSSR